MTQAKPAGGSGTMLGLGLAEIQQRLHEALDPREKSQDSRGALQSPVSTRR
jgi:hypothetical protein